MAWTIFVLFVVYSVLRLRLRQQRFRGNLLASCDGLMGDSSWRSIVLHTNVDQLRTTADAHRTLVLGLVRCSIRISCDWYVFVSVRAGYLCQHQLQEATIAHQKFATSSYLSPSCQIAELVSREFIFQSYRRMYTKLLALTVSSLPIDTSPAYTNHVPSLSIHSHIHQPPNQSPRFY